MTYVVPQISFLGVMCSAQDCEVHILYPYHQVTKVRICYYATLLWSIE